MLGNFPKAFPNLQLPNGIFPSGNFPMVFSQVATSEWYFPTLQHPNCAMSQAANSQVF